MLTPRHVLFVLQLIKFKLAHFLGNATSPPVNLTSAQPVVTTGAPATTTAAPSAESKITLGFKLQQNFTSQLANKSSQEFNYLANKVKATVSTLMFLVILLNVTLNKIYNECELLNNTYQHICMFRKNKSA